MAGDGQTRVSHRRPGIPAKASFLPGRRSHGVAVLAVVRACALARPSTACDVATDRALLLPWSRRRGRSERTDVVAAVLGRLERTDVVAQADRGGRESMTAPPRPTARRPSNQRRSALECVAIARQRPSRRSSSVPCSPAAYSRCRSRRTSPLPTHRIFSFASVSSASIVYLNNWQRGVAPLSMGAVLTAYPMNELTSTSTRRES